MSDIAGISSAAYENQVVDWDAQAALKRGAQIDAMKEKARLWLKTVYSSPLAHKAAIVLGATLNGTNAVTGIHRFGKLSQGISSIVAGIGSIAGELLQGVGNANIGGLSIYEEINGVMDELKNPNLGGVPIHADSEIESTDIDVATQLYINEAASNKQYVMDNAAPKPRTWQIKGYIMSNPNLDTGLIIKPSLIAQRKILQYYADLRKPIVYKTHDCRFFTVLISHFDSSYVPNALNGLQVNLNLVEFKVLEISSTDEGLDTNAITASPE